MKITWIASYPKSGNTWMRFMIYTAVFGPPKHSIDVARKIPDIHRPLPFDQPADGRLFAKTHLALSDAHPKLRETERAIHIIRNPKDVLLSALNYRRMGSDGAEPLDRERYARLFIAERGDPAWKQQGHGSWGENARSWRTTDRFPVLPVCYEQLKHDPHAELARVLAFLGIEKTPDEITEIVRTTSFDAMRAMEIREKNDKTRQTDDRRLFVGSRRAASKGVYFMNSGKTGQSLESIAPGLDELFNNAFADELRVLGYAS